MIKVVHCAESDEVRVDEFPRGARIIVTTTGVLRIEDSRKATLAVYAPELWTVARRGPTEHRPARRHVVADA